MPVQVKRVFDGPTTTDGYRVLVDRLWPRGVSRRAAALDGWLKVLAPSDELRHWFAHDPAKWGEFTRRYREELAAPALAVASADLKLRARAGMVTLVYAAADTTHNNAVVLRDFLIDQPDPEAP